MLMLINILMLKKHFMNIKLQRLVAKITGNSPIYAGNTFLTLDASQSYNPNEKDTKKYLLYTWECNNIKDDNCKRITTKGIIIFIYCGTHKTVHDLN